MPKTLAPLLLLCVALASVGVGMVWLLQRDRARLVQEFATDRQRQLEEATRGVGQALQEIGDDLRFAGELISQPSSSSDHRRELRALLEVVRPYKAILVLDADGSERLRLVDRRADRSFARGPHMTALLETARRALAAPPGEVLTSQPVTGAPGAWLRAFATALPPGEDPAVPGGGAEQRPGVVAVLVDTEPFFAPVHLMTSDWENRLLLLGAHGSPTPASDPWLVEWFRRLKTPEGAEVPGFAKLFERMRAGERGIQNLTEDEADRLGLGRADAVAVFTPIRARGASHWSVATLHSTTELRSHERGLVLRLSLAALLVTVFIVAFGVYVLLASRRAVALRESQRHALRLAHLHDKTQKILDNIPTGVLALAADGHISAVNQALRERLPAGSVGQPLAAAFPRAPEATMARVRALVDAATQGGVTSVHGEPLALFGEEGVYSLHAVALEPADPEVRTLLVVEDLSNVRALETQLLRAEKLATVGVLAAGIAHEIGTPLGVVRGRAEYVQGKLGPQHPQSAGVGVIVEQIDRVSRTLRQLLDFARLQRAVVRPVQLGPLARSVQELLRLESARRKVPLELQLPPEGGADALPPLAADPDQLQQVLVNLCLNALDACSEGGHVRLGASAPKDGEHWGLVALRVQDDGCGIPQESLNQVFDPFFTTKKRGQGTGLGLSMVAQIVRNHGGRVELESEPGRGTCVTLWWPVAGPSTARDGGSSSSESAAAKEEQRRVG